MNHAQRSLLTLAYRSLARSAAVPAERTACYQWAVAAVVRAASEFGVNNIQHSEWCARQLGSMTPELSAILAGAFVR